MSDKSQFAPGQNADGTIDVMTEEAARVGLLQRNADEKAFNELLAGKNIPDESPKLETETDDTFEEDLDDVSDLGEEE